MPHKYLPRLARGVLAVGLLACGDPAGPGGGGGSSGQRLALSVTRPAGDTLTQLGFDVTVGFSDTTAHQVRLYVDSGTAGERRTAWPFASVLTLPSHVLDAVAMAPGPGRHTFTLVAADTAGRPLASQTFAYTVAVPDEAYAAAALPDLGSGGGALGLASTGDVAGYVLTAAGRKRPAVWRAGVLRVLPVSDSVDVAAARVNASGDVLLQSYRPGAVTSFNAGATAARVLRADGALLNVGPLKSDLVSAGGVRPSDFCCTHAADLNDRRQALGTTVTTASFDQSAILDVPRGVRTDSTLNRLLVLNNAGHAAGYAQGGLTSPGVVLETLGFTAPTIPGTPLSALFRPACGSSRGVILYGDTPIDLDDAGTLLVSRCGNALLAQSGGVRYVDRMVGPGRQVHLSRQGGLVAALDSTGAIYLWRTAGTRVTRLRVAGDPWRFDSLAAVNAAGAIAAYGTSAASGRGAALLLTPAAR